MGLDGAVTPVKRPLEPKRLTRLQLDTILADLATFEHRASVRRGLLEDVLSHIEAVEYEAAWYAQQLAYEKAASSPYSMLRIDVNYIDTKEEPDGVFSPANATD